MFSLLNKKSSQPKVIFHPELEFRQSIKDAVVCENAGLGQRYALFVKNRMGQLLLEGFVFQGYYCGPKIFAAKRLYCCNTFK